MRLGEIEDEFEYTVHGVLYKGYTLNDTVDPWELTPKQLELLDVSIYIVDNKITLRRTAKEYRIPRSTLQDRVNRDLSKISHELYQVVHRQPLLNKQKYFK